MEIFIGGIFAGITIILFWGAALIVRDKDRAFWERRTKMEAEKELKKSEKL